MLISNRSPTSMPARRRLTPTYRLIPNALSQQARRAEVRHLGRARPITALLALRISRSTSILLSDHLPLGSTSPPCKWVVRLGAVVIPGYSGAESLLGACLRPRDERLD